MSRKKNKNYPAYSNFPNAQPIQPHDSTDNTDLYDDDVSRKAVGRLFDGDVDDTYADEEFYDEAYDDSDGTAESYDDFDSMHTDTDDAYDEPTEEEDPDLAYKNYIASVSEIMTSPRPMPKRPERTRDATKSPVYKKVEPRQPAPAYTANTYAQDDDTEDYDEPSSPGKSGIGTFVKSMSSGDFRLIAAGAGIVVLIIFVFLIIKINAGSAEVKRLKEDLAAADTIKTAHQQLLIDYETLREQHQALIDSGVQTPPIDPSQPDTPDQSDTPDQPTDGTTATPEPTQPPATAAPPSSMEEYTVVSGDSFSKIAEKLYGAASRADELMRVNNYTDPTKLKVNDVLKIPRP